MASRANGCSRKRARSIAREEEGANPIPTFWV
jgi:hypothetical protein